MKTAYILIMANELPTEDTKQGEGINVGNPIDRKEQFEVVSSNLEQFMAEQDDPKWRLSVLEELEVETKKKNPDWLGGYNVSEYIIKQIERVEKVAAEYYGGQVPQTLRYLIDSIPNLHDQASLERVAFILYSTRGVSAKSDGILIPKETRRRRQSEYMQTILKVPIDPLEFRFGQQSLTNPSVYAFSHSEATLRKMRDFSDSLSSWRSVNGGQVIQWRENWWNSEHTWWNRKPENQNQLNQLLQAQNLVVDLSTGDEEWDKIRPILELCKSEDVSHILTGKAQNLIYAHHFVRNVSQ